MNVSTQSPGRVAIEVERKLQLGCFDQPLDGWINADVTPHLFVAKVPFLASAMYRLGRMSEIRYQQHRPGIFKKLSYVNVAKRFPFPPDSISCVFSSHLLEHIPRSIVPRMLDEIRRVLKPGGVVRTVVPDLDYFVEHYDPLNPDIFVDRVFENNHTATKNCHHWMYNRHSLVRLLQERGFKDVEVCNFQQGKCKDLDRLDNRPGYSLYVEGTKP
jgi:predicted SAM-dependent methyltransferase